MTAPSKVHSKVIFFGLKPQYFENVQTIFKLIPDHQSQLHFVTHAEDWISGLLTDQFDVGILDASSGVECIPMLKWVQEKAIGIPVVLLTGGEDREFDIEVMKLGAADSVVRERITPYALERIIRHALFRKRVQEEMRARDADLLIQERLAAVGMLASGMAHEIGTPLGVIRGRAEVLLLRNPNSETLERDLRIIIDQSDRIAKLMRSLLNLARGDDMRTSHAVDIRSVVNDVLDVMRQVLATDGIEVRNEIPESIHFKVYAESEPFHQILLNLIQNALHAIEAARHAGRKEGHFIGISIDDGQSEWKLRVQDSGIGMKPEVLRSLFRPFFTTKGIGKGTGLGLSLSHRILESWKGSITAESIPEVGSVFQITVPKA